MNDEIIRPYETNDQAHLTRLVDGFQSHMSRVDPSQEAQPFTSDDDRRSYVVQMLKDVESMEGVILVAESGVGQLVGFSSGIVNRRPTDDDVMFSTTHQPAVQGWIGLLFVDEGQRGKGIGRALLDGMKSSFESKGCTSLRLLVSTTNESAIGLYRRAGLAEREVEMSMPL